MMPKIPELEKIKNLPRPEVPQVTFAGHARAIWKLIAHRYFKRTRHFSGNADEICRQIIAKLWNRKFYLTSLGHFDYLWIRDFGTVAESLIKLGHADNVRQTVKWSLHHYRRAGKVTLCIDKLGQVFNAPEQSIDALPWLLHSIIVSEYELSDRERIFLEQQLLDFSETFLTSSGRLREGHFAELRDGVLYNSSAYAVTLLARMASCVEQLGLAGFRFPSRLYRNLLLERYWNGEYFNADDSTDAFSAECSVFPFVLGVIDDADKALRLFEYIEKNGYNDPYPLHYTFTPDVFRYRWWAVSVMKNYAGTTIWTWHGAFYLQLLKKYDHPSYPSQKQKMTDMIERYKTFPELLNPDGSIYKTVAYKSDEAMIWCAIYLALSDEELT